jgi:NAD(P)H-hydrate epimerase
MKPHDFQQAARQFRAGKISLNEFTERVFPARPVAGGARQGPGIGSSLQRLLQRPADSHKGDYGRVLIVAGSPGMAGAAALTGMAALRAGSGLVTVATDRRCQATVAAFHPSLMTIGLSLADEQSTDGGVLLSSQIAAADCIAMGPGLGQTEPVGRLVREIVRQARVPVVVDADGLNCLAGDFDFDGCDTPLVLTPHPGEMARLMPSPVFDRQQQEAWAAELAVRSGSVGVLKGHHTLIADGSQSVHNPTGNPGIATAGSGDVLTGVIAALIGQGLSRWESAVLGCYLHGLAGDLAATDMSQVAMVSTDIIDRLPAAIGKMASRDGTPITGSLSET